MRNPVWPSSCVTPAGTSNELDVQNEWEENTHTHSEYYVPWYVQPFFCIFVISSQTLCMILLIGLGSINTYSTNDDSGEEPKHTHTPDLRLFSWLLLHQRCSNKNYFSDHFFCIFVIIWSQTLCLIHGGTAEPVSRDQILGRGRGQGNVHILPIQLTTSRTGNLNILPVWSILLLWYVWQCIHNTNDIGKKQNSNE